MAGSPNVSTTQLEDSLHIGNRTYELTNHLGNVLVTISDKIIGNDSSGVVNYYIAETLSQQDFYPFGMLMPGRKFDHSSLIYRHGFNGKENDDEVKGDGNQQDYGMRIYDPRLGRFLSVDPLMKSYPMLTPYQFASNSPIDGIDLDGLEYLSFHKSMYRMQYKIPSSQYVVSIVYQNIPNEIKDPENQTFKYIGTGPVTAFGRDFDPNLDGPAFVQPGKYYQKGPKFYGLAEDGSSTKDITTLKGNATPSTLLLAQNINGFGSIWGSNGAGVFSNWFNMFFNDIQGALNTEADLKRGFYQATNTFDKNNAAKIFGGTLLTGNDRSNLINFMTDGYLPMKDLDYVKSNSKQELSALSDVLNIAYYGVQILGQLNKLRPETKNYVNELLKKYKDLGGDDTKYREMIPFINND